MALTPIWVDSAAVGLNNGTSYANAYTDLQTALTAWTTSNIIYLVYTSSEAFAIAKTYTCSSTDADPCLIVTVNSSGVYTKATGANVDLSSGTGTLQFNFRLRNKGMYVKTNGSIKLHGAGYHVWDNCTVQSLNATSIELGLYNGSTTDLYNTNILLGNASTYLHLSEGNMYGGSVSGTLTTTSVPVRANFYASFKFHGVDFSGCTGITTGSLTYNTSSTYGYTEFYSCKVPSSISLCGTLNKAGQYVVFSKCDSGGEFSRNEYYNYYGSSVTTTSIYDDASALEYYNGTTKKSVRIVPGANVKYGNWVYGQPMAALVTATGSKTFTIELAHNFTASLTDQDVHLEVLSFDTAASVLGAVAVTLPAYPATPATLTSSSATWTGGGALTKQKISYTTTVNNKGPVWVRLALNKYEASKNLYHSATVQVT